MNVRLERFLAFSTDVTAFPSYALRGTGLVEAHLRTVSEIVGDELVHELLERHAAIEGDRVEGLRREIFSDERLGPVARNIVKLWFVGIWYELPAAWRDAYGARDGDVTFTPSPAAYTESLLWPAIGANPPGAKAPGYGSWAAPPRIPEPAG